MGGEGGVGWGGVGDRMGVEADFFMIMTKHKRKKI